MTPADTPPPIPRAGTPRPGTPRPDRPPAAIAVVGLHGGRPYGPAAFEALARAGVVVGSPRHLEATVGLRAEASTVPLTGPLDAVIDRVEEASDAGQAVCVLASGDPGFFGIVRALGQRVGPSRLEVHPAPSSVALAFARIGEPWDDALIVSAHGRPLEHAVAAVRASDAPSVAVLTAPANPPEAVGRALIAAGLRSAGDVVVASHLGDARESVTRTDLAGLAAGAFDPMSVVILRHLHAARNPPSPAPGGPAVAGERLEGARLSWGLPESDFEHRDGMITKAEVRAVALGKLRLPPTGVMWDVGAGSGSVAVECAGLAPGLRVVAIERDPRQAARIRANAAAHRVGVEVVEGEAPGALAGLPDPDRVFVGGGGLGVLDEALRRLRPGGTVVATFALVERALGAAGRLGNLVQLSVSRGVATGELGLRLRAENPVFLAWGPA
ncbi:precorrin-6y C5,15-methyltransferase (decarboxylating) subunit CbiE [Acidiferrimicrobium sp. IK]|uniref:precorrin-6y C5,15-methyltransferase (decarboxylating) subunit CbiE n=1 Tax=Acidiferrimicrobium sp. IK TaxID=2871700 RepID=UPI0021CB5BF0|nr:precorrin-6y C5,15-methyltransferase (decarboxylating) subunit CbiE [Acidiferrimicrobium sp. IK]MCU4187446.1 precorrin-6y C5,15-methyltransferase (decarboxylating) subunit CbiE [Acidiferrimicrobium sp. IK]